MATLEFVRVGNDTLVSLSSLRNGRTLAYMNAATVAVVINDLAGTEVVSSQSLSYVADSDGDYYVSLDKSLTSTLTVGALYYVIVTTSEGGVDGEFRAKVQYEYRDV